MALGEGLTLSTRNGALSTYSCLVEELDRDADCASHGCVFVFAKSINVYIMASIRGLCLVE